MRNRIDLFIASVLVLFLELACIRWFPAHVLFLTFFTNVILLAAFLGIAGFSSVVFTFVWMTVFRTSVPPP